MFVGLQEQEDKMEEIQTKEFVKRGKLYECPQCGMAQIPEFEGKIMKCSNYGCQYKEGETPDPGKVSCIII